MQSHFEDASPKAKLKSSSSSNYLKKSRKRSLNSIPTDVRDIDVNQSNEHPQNQLVPFNPNANDVGAEIEQTSAVTDHITSSFPSLSSYNPFSKVLPSVGAFTVQCARCFQWRIIPTKEKYEEIRENILQNPFLCENAQEWRPNVSCSDPPDICQDRSRLWAIDKPSIAQPPPGWERLLRIRGEGSTKFADVYYVAPSGKRLRSMVEVQKYLQEHRVYTAQGVTLSQFSFQIPKPLQENYVRKRVPRFTNNPVNSICGSIQRPLEPDEVNPLSWASPVACTADLRVDASGPSTPSSESLATRTVLREPPAKKKFHAGISSQKKVWRPVLGEPDVEVEDTPLAKHASSYEL